MRQGLGQVAPGQVPAAWRPGARCAPAQMPGGWPGRRGWGQSCCVEAVPAKGAAAVVVEPFACNRLNVKHEPSVSPSARRRRPRVAARPGSTRAGPSGAAAVGAWRPLLRRLRLVAGGHRRRAGPASRRKCPRCAGLRGLAGARAGSVVGWLPPGRAASRAGLERHRRAGSGGRRTAASGCPARPGPCPAWQRASTRGLAGRRRCYTLIHGSDLRP